VRVFLHFDNRFGALQLLLQTFDLAAQVRILEGERIGVDAAFLRGEPISEALRALPTPRGEMRGVQAFPPNQCATLRRGRASVGFVQDALLVFRSVLAALGFWSDLGVRVNGRLVSILRHVGASGVPRPHLTLN
jgi:hypothetical protein